MIEHTFATLTLVTQARPGGLPLPSPSMAWSGGLNIAQLLLGEDSRGNRLSAYHATQRRDRSTIWLDLLCSDDIANQFKRALALGGRNPQFEQPRDTTQWSHRLRFDGPYVSSIKDLCELLKTALTLQTEAEITTAIALDFYKIPPDEERGTGWRDTEAGALVNHKYWKTNLKQVEQAGSALSDKLVEVINRHPTYRDAEVIVQIPGTQHKFGERLAQTVAHRTGKPLVKARCLDSGHAPAKEGHASGALQRYEVTGDVDWTTVIIVDDVYKSGVTMRSVASAALEAGAIEVLGLVGARTMRRS